MTRAEQHLVGSALTTIWRATLHAADDGSDALRADLVEALRRLVPLVPDGPQVLAALAASAGPQGTHLYHLILPQERSHEPERQLRLALGDAG